MVDEENIAQSYPFKELRSRVDELEHKINDMHDQIIINTTMINKGMSTGAEKAFSDVNLVIAALRKEVNELEAKTNKWEGGGAALYSLMIAGGVFIGYLLNHFVIVK